MARRVLVVAGFWASAGVAACGGGDETVGEAPPLRSDAGKGGAAGSKVADLPQSGAGGSVDTVGSGGSVVTGSGGSTIGAGGFAGSASGFGGSASGSAGSGGDFAGSAGVGGITTSTGGASAMACVPAPEVCDGVRDDDCDGVVDNGCACVNGTTVACEAACGAGVRTCSGGVLGACSGPGFDGSGKCPCPAGTFRGTNGDCYTSATCTVVVQGGVLKVGAGKSATKAMSCPGGFYAAEARYVGTSVPCSWKSDSTSATLTCTNGGSGSVDADGLRLTCSCQKPNSVSYTCSNCNCSNCK